MKVIAIIIKSAITVGMLIWGLNLYDNYNPKNIGTILFYIVLCLPYAIGMEYILSILAKSILKTIKSDRPE